MSYEPPQVRRIYTDGGSHIEPELDQDATDLDKLRWHAAVAEHDTGIRIRVNPANYRVKRHGKWRDVPGLYSFQTRRASGGSYDLREMWAFISGFAHCAENHEAK